MIKKGIIISIDSSSDSLSMLNSQVLVENLKQRGYKTSYYKFVNLDSSPAYFLKQYKQHNLSNNLTPKPYAPALFYALEHYGSIDSINSDLEAGRIVICSQYLISNIIKSARGQDDIKAIIQWVESLEFNMLALPKPDLSIILSDKNNTQEHKLIANLQSSTSAKTKLICTESNGKSIDNEIQTAANRFLNSQQLARDDIRTENQTGTIIKVAASALAESLMLDNNNDGGPKARIFNTNNSEGIDIQRYYVPRLKSDIKTKYTKTMDKIFDTYTKMVHDLTDYVQSNSETPKEEQGESWYLVTKTQASDALRGVLPVATTSTVNISGSEQAIENLITHFQSDETSEAREIVQNMLNQAREVMGVFLERANKPNRDGAWAMYKSQTSDSLAKITQKLVPNNLSNDLKSTHLISVSPRNELDLVPCMLYENSELSLRELQDEISGWSYNKKQQVLLAYIGDGLNRRHRPGRALENANYTWDIVCDYGIFRDLQRHRMVNNLNWQKLTPRYGYEVPKLIEEAGLSDLYERCFDLSLKLYSDMQAAGYIVEAQYTTLFGHRMRWKVTYNAREAFHLHELHTSPKSHPGYRKLIMEMHEQLANVHPLLAEGIKFVYDKLDK